MQNPIAGPDLAANNEPDRPIGHEGTKNKALANARLRHDFFRKIGDYPQAGVCERFADIRARVRACLEGEVFRCNVDFEQFLIALRAGEKDAQPEREVDAEYRRKLRSLDDWLYLQARAAKQGVWVSQAPDPELHDMDFYRAHLPNGLAPNGRDSTRYGRQGGPVPSFVMTPYSQNLSPVEQLLGFTVLDLYHKYVWEPLKRIWKRLRNGKQDTDDEGEDEGQDGVPDVDGRTVGIIAKVVAYMLASLSLAVAIGVLDSISDQNNRIVVMTLFGLGFASSVHFIGQDTIPMYQLITAYFQAMVIFVGTSGPNVTH